MRRLVLFNQKVLASPKVLSSKEISKNTIDFKMYDAIPAAQQSSYSGDSSEMDKFLPMLNDYLKSECDFAPFRMALYKRIYSPRYGDRQ